MLCPYPSLLVAQAGAKEDTIVERYIGTIFSKQQTGFKQNLRDLTPKLPRLDVTAVETLTKNVLSFRFPIGYKSARRRARHEARPERI